MTSEAAFYAIRPKPTCYPAKVMLNPPRRKLFLKIQRHGASPLESRPFAPSRPLMNTLIAWANQPTGDNVGIASLVSDSNVIDPLFRAGVSGLLLPLQIHEGRP